ncbi:hypothetical protein DPD72_14610 [Salmonella enterica subsp. salamae]|nr:hypothetical protein [Salmonella enterica subsp. salamae]
MPAHPLISFVFPAANALAAFVHPGHIVIYAPGVNELAAFLQREILWRKLIGSNIIFANAACRRGILAPEFVQCSAPGRAASSPGRFFFQPSRGHNV